MPPSTPTLDRLCHDEATRTEAYRILLVARSLTGPGSGFDLGGISSGLDAICAYLASCNLKNTSVTIEAAQVASRQSLPNFKHLRNKVAGALQAHRAAHRARKSNLLHPSKPPASSPAGSKANPRLLTPPLLSRAPAPRHHTTSVQPVRSKQRRFRPVFRDQQQWEMRDPRAAIQTAVGEENLQRMIRMYGLPFQDFREDVKAIS
ncbi:hypothetical protein C8R43DRAFT_1140348 [Mycena crocata]|nr:hypothetical protein C8R43DRAFT_1140348 [Mycena crocata]